MGPGWKEIVWSALFDEESRAERAQRQMAATARFYELQRLRVRQGRPPSSECEEQEIRARRARAREEQLARAQERSRSRKRARDRAREREAAAATPLTADALWARDFGDELQPGGSQRYGQGLEGSGNVCLLYTSDAADE